MFKKIAGTSIATALFAIQITSLASAETTKADLAKKKVQQVTCDDFIGLSETFKPTVVAWVAGFRKGDTKPDDVAIDIDGIEKVTPFIVAACRQDPKASFWSKAESEMKKAF